MKEINETYAAVVIAAARQTGVDMERITVHGAVALGHPAGASARIVATLLYVMREREGRPGVRAVGLDGEEAPSVAIGRV